jgi:hypothetical protein
MTQAVVQRPIPNTTDNGVQFFDGTYSCYYHCHVHQVVDKKREKYEAKNRALTNSFEELSSLIPYTQRSSLSCGTLSGAEAVLTAVY